MTVGIESLGDTARFEVKERRLGTTLYRGRDDVADDVSNAFSSEGSFVALSIVGSFSSRVRRKVSGRAGSVGSALLNETYLGRNCDSTRHHDDKWGQLV